MYGRTIGYIVLVGLLFIAKTLKVVSGNPRYSGTCGGVIVLATIVFLYSEWNDDYADVIAEECSDMPKGDESNDNKEVFNAILTSSGKKIPPEQLSHLSDEFTKFLYGKILEERLYTTTGVLPPKVKEGMAAKELARGVHSEIMEKSRLAIGGLNAQLAVLKSDTTGEDSEETVKKIQELERELKEEQEKFEASSLALDKLDSRVETEGDEPVVVTPINVLEPEPEPVVVTPINVLEPEPDPVVVTPINVLEPEPEPVVVTPINVLEPEPEPEPIVVTPINVLEPEPEPVVVTPINVLEPEPEPVVVTPINVLEPEPEPEPVVVTPINVLEPEPEPIGMSIASS